MTYPQRKKLTDYSIVTPTLSDSLVNIQSNTVKRSTIQSILDLFSSTIPQASDTVKGLAELSNQTEAEAAASDVLANIDNTKILTPKGWRWAWDKALTLAWAFTSKITFSKGVNLVSSTFPAVDGDLVFNSTRYNGRISGGVVSLISNADVATETSIGVTLLANDTEMILGANNSKAITPFRLQTRTLNIASNISGLTSATLNTINGIITYSSGAASSTVSYYTMSNSYINSLSYIVPTIKVNPGESAVLLFGGYSISGSTVTFYVYNASAFTSSDFKIHFQIVG